MLQKYLNYLTMLLLNYVQRNRKLIEKIKRRRKGNLEVSPKVWRRRIIDGKTFSHSAECENVVNIRENLAHRTNSIL